MILTLSQLRYVSRLPSGIVISSRDFPRTVKIAEKYVNFSTCQIDRSVCTDINLSIG